MTLTYLREAPEQTGFMTVPLAPGEYRFVVRAHARRSAVAAARRCSGCCCARCCIVGRSARAAACRRLKRALAAVGRRGSTRCRSRASHALRLWLLGGARRRPRSRARSCSALWRAAARAQGARADPRRARALRLPGEHRGKAQREHRVPRIDAAVPAPGRPLTCAATSTATSTTSATSRAARPRSRSTRWCAASARAPSRTRVLSIEYPRVPIGDAIVGYYGIERAGRLMYRRRPVQMRVMVERPARVRRPNQSPTTRCTGSTIPMNGIPRQRSTRHVLGAAPTTSASATSASTRRW